MRDRGAPPLAGLDRVSPSLGRRAPVLVPGRGWGGHMGRGERKGPAPTWMAACAGLVLPALMLLAAAVGDDWHDEHVSGPARLSYQVH